MKEFNVAASKEDSRQNEIIRIQKKQNNFVMLDKGFLEDNRLSFKAKGILAYLLSKPDNWKVVVKDLVNHSKEGKAAIHSGLRELKKYGYYKKQPVRENGVISYWESVIYECPNYTEPPEPPKKKEKEPIVPLLTDFQEIDNLKIDNLKIDNQTRNNIYHNQNKSYQDLVSINQSEQDKSDSDIDNDSIDILANPIEIPKIVADKICLEELKKEYADKEKTLELMELYNITCQVLTTYDVETIRIAKQNVKLTTVKQTFAKLNKSHFQYILYCLSNNYKIKGNVKNYLTTALFNSTRTICFYSNKSFIQPNKAKDIENIEEFINSRVKKSMHF